MLTETVAIAAWLEARDSERHISFTPLSPEADRMHQLIGFIDTGFTSAFSPLGRDGDGETEPANAVVSA